MALGSIVTGTLAHRDNKAALRETRRANAELTGRMERGQQDIFAQRPIAAQNRVNAMRQQLGALGPVNGLVDEMGGGRGGLDLEGLGQNPLTLVAGEGQLNPLGRDGKVDYQRWGLFDAQGKPITDPAMARAELERRASAQGYQLPGGAQAPATPPTPPTPPTPAAAPTAQSPSIGQPVGYVPPRQRGLR